MSRLVTNMLTLLRAEDFRRTLQRRPVELAKLIRGSRRPGPAVHPRASSPAGGRFGAGPRHVRDRSRQDHRSARQPDDQRHQVHARLRSDHAPRPARRRPRPGRRSRSRIAASALRRTPSNTCSSRSSLNSTPAAIRRATSGSRSGGSVWACASPSNSSRCTGGPSWPRASTAGGTRLTVRLPRIEAPAADPTAPPSDGRRRPSPNPARSPRRIIEDRPALRREREPILA